MRLTLVSNDFHERCTNGSGLRALVIDISPQPLRQVIEQQAVPSDVFEVRMRDQPDLPLEHHFFGENWNQTRVTARDIELACGDAETGSEHRHLRRDVVGPESKVLSPQLGGCAARCSQDVHVTIEADEAMVREVGERPRPPISLDMAAEVKK